MMPRHLRITTLVLIAWALLVVFFLPGMRGRLVRLSQLGQRPAEEQARREVTRVGSEAASGPRVKARLFWADAERSGVVPVELELPLAAEPAPRARQLLEALIARVPGEAQRTLPGDAAVLEFYLLADGTGVADFSSALATSLPSGIRSEQLALESITRTLAANLPGVWRVKILLQGQEAETLAGHADLTGFFVLRAPSPAKPPAGAPAEKNPEGRGLRSTE
jgi:hypothetical protein